MALVERWRDEELSAVLLEQAIRSGCERMGIEELKPEQQKAVQTLLRGENVFVTLPTGYGKSAIFHILPFCVMALLSLLSLSSSADSCLPFVLIISPLVSLMRDQVTKLRRRGIQTALVGEDSPADVRSCRFTHVFSSPEAILQGDTWRSVLLSEEFASNITAVCIDEAHCIVK